jgi:hypothetical protein
MDLGLASHSLRSTDDARENSTQFYLKLGGKNSVVNIGHGRERWIMLLAL